MRKSLGILRIDPYLKPFKADLELRLTNYEDTKKKLLGNRRSLTYFANGHLYFGFHKKKSGWYYREWAPNATEIALIGDFNGWDRTSHKLKQLQNGVWEIFIPGAGTIAHGSKIKIEITADGKKFDRIPLYCKRVIQDPASKSFDGQFWNPAEPFAWSDSGFSADNSKPLLIYECHIGMSGLKEDVSSFSDFTELMLPRIKKLGYNAIQLMAIAEHPYYGSFGYQVSNLFAVSSRFGTPEDLKRLINTAHSMGITVLMDLVHSHAAKNADEGLALFDGTDYQFFHSGAAGNHPAWGTKLYNYGKPEVIHFLLSNIKFWLDEYHFDGFRFDGVTSMLYHDHGLGESFDNYAKYFSMNTDTEAVTYLQLAAELAKKVRPDCVLIAEDMSGMPGMCLPIDKGGMGFDYRLAMGMPDFWIRTLRESRDENWDIGKLWYELNQRRPSEKVIGYCESHDQALVGDKTIMFWLADKEMYWHMDKNSQSGAIDRAIALHKMIRLITCTCAGDGYLNFMGNEFGHPEWIDFPREGNNWSYFYARRRWDLADDENLRYKYLQNFDEAMINFVRDSKILAQKSNLLYHGEKTKVLVYEKGGYIFAFNFHPNENCVVNIKLGNYSCPSLVLHSGDSNFGGYINTAENSSSKDIEPLGDGSLKISLNSRTAVVYNLAAVPPRQRYPALLLGAVYR